MDYVVAFVGVVVVRVWMLVGLSARQVAEMTEWHGMLCSDGSCMSSGYDTLCMLSMG
jgi:hypothetical protein